jgi:hypothetical protein
MSAGVFEYPTLEMVHPYADDILPPLQELVVSPPCFDVELVSQLMPNAAEPHGEAAMLNLLMETGSRTLTKDDSPEVKQKTHIAREMFYTRLGWSEPAHSLYAWYCNEVKARPNGIDPSTVTQNIQFTRDLYDGQDLVTNIARTSQFLSSKTETLLKEYNHIARLAGVAGWSAQDVRQLVQAQPLLLKRSSKTQFFYARAAAEHGEELGLTEDPESFLKRGPFANTSPHALVAKFAAMPVDAKRQSTGKGEMPSNFLRSVNSELRQRKVGTRVLQAYFRAYPVKDGLLLRDTYPRLQSYHQAFISEWNRKTGFIEVAEILPVPDDTWFKSAALRGKRIDIAALNRHMQTGSRKLHNKARNFEALSAETHQARANFVEELGWFDPTHPLYDVACRIRDSEKMTWPSPSNMVDIITLLSQHTADPIHCIRAVGLPLIASKAEAVEKKILAAKQVFGDEDILYRWPNILRKSVAEIMVLEQVKRGPIRSKVGASRVPESIIAPPDQTAVDTLPPVLSEQAVEEVTPVIPLLTHPNQRFALFTTELSEHPLSKPIRLPIQIVQGLPIAERAAVYAAHCLPWLLTDRMIQEGWHDPANIMQHFGLRNRAELVAYVSANIMPKVHEECAREPKRATNMDAIHALFEYLGFDASDAK